MRRMICKEAWDDVLPRQRRHSLVRQWAGDSESEHELDVLSQVFANTTGIVSEKRLHELHVKDEPAERDISPNHDERAAVLGEE